MFSEEVWAALIGALIGGLIALIGIIIAAIFENRRLKIESKTRDSEWRREKCNEAYSHAIYYLFKLQVSSATNDISDKDVRQHLSESQRYLSLLQAYHPVDKERERIRSAADKLRAAVGMPQMLSSKAGEALNVVEESLHNSWSPSIRN